MKIKKSQLQSIIEATVLEILREVDKEEEGANPPADVSTPITEGKKVKPAPKKPVKPAPKKTPKKK